MSFWLGLGSMCPIFWYLSHRAVSPHPRRQHLLQHHPHHHPVRPQRHVRRPHARRYREEVPQILGTSCSCRQHESKKNLYLVCHVLCHLFNCSYSSINTLVLPSTAPSFPPPNTLFSMIVFPESVTVTVLLLPFTALDSPPPNTLP